MRASRTSTAGTLAAQTESRLAREDERQRIASDFHDGPLQSFISLQMRLEIVRKLLERDLKAGQHELQTVQDIAKSQVRELRAFLHSMRPVEIDGGNLSISARRVIDNFQKESGIPVTLVGGDASLAISQEMMSEVLQMLREALHNVQKHASASRVAVAIQKSDKTARALRRRQRPRLPLQRRVFPGRVGAPPAGPRQSEAPRPQPECRPASWSPAPDRAPA